MKRYFIDMDGTLAKWNNVSFEELFEEGYYRNLEPHTEVVNTVQKMIEKGEDVYILSAYLPNSEFALKEKQEWIHSHLPSLSNNYCIFVPYGENKSNYIENGVGKDDILLDDYTKNLDDWTLQGGTAIKLLNGVNHTKGTWHGKKINIDEIDENFLNKAISHEIKLGDQYYKITHYPKLDDDLKVNFEIYDYDNIEMIGIDFNDKIERPLQFIRWASDKKRRLEPRGEYGIIKDKLELLEMKKEVYLALQLIHDDVNFDGLIKELEIQIQEEYSKKYPNLSQSRDFEILKYYLNTSELEYMEDEINKYENLVPDISYREMDNYGYSFEEMIPLEKKHALEIYRNNDIEVYALYSDNTEALINNEEELLEHEGLFGVEMIKTLPIRWYEGLENAKDIIENLKEKSVMKSNTNIVKIKYTDIHKKPPVEQRNINLFYYDYRSADDAIGYTIERNVLVNNIGSLVTNVDILGEKDFLNDDDFMKLNPEYVTNIEELLEENKRLLSNPSIKAKNFIGDFEKMKDFFELNKDEFLESYSYLTEQEYDKTYQKIREIEVDKNKKIININGEKFILKFNHTYESNELKWYDFSADCLTKKDIFYDLQMCFNERNGSCVFEIVSVAREPEDVWNEWKKFEDVIINSKEREVIESTLIEWSNQILLENNQSNSKEENNIEDDFEDFDL